MERKIDQFILSIVVLVIVLIGIFYVNYNYQETYYKNKKLSVTGFALNPSDISSVQRSFSDATPKFGDTIDVTINVLIDSNFDHTVYIVEEHVPENLTIVDNGGATQNGHILKWTEVNTQGVSSTTFTYTVSIPNQKDNFSFIGYYGVDGMDSAVNIGGEYLVSVSEKIWAFCSECGSGLFNFCDRVECESILENCYFTQGFFVSSCDPCSNADSCENYFDDQLTCISDACGFGNCQWDGTKCVSITSCVPNWVNTSWSGWMNVSCLPNNTMNQTSVMMQYDANSCPFSHRTVYKRSRAILSCDYNSWRPHIHLNWNYFDMNYTTNFSRFNKTGLQRLSEVRFKAKDKKTRLKFLNRVNISRDINLTNNLLIGHRWVYIDSSNLPEFNNKPALISFYDVNYVSPVIYRDGVVCPSSYCTNITYNKTSNIYSFVVGSFSNYSISENAYCGDGNCDSDVGESCSTCPQDCGSCPSSGGSSGGGGGGGGSSSTLPATNNTISNDYTPTVQNEQSSQYTPSIENGSETSNENQPSGDILKQKIKLGLTIALIFISVGIIVVIVFIIFYLRGSPIKKSKENILLKKIREKNL